MAHRNSGAVKLLLVDDHEIVRMGLRTLFAQTRDIVVVGESATASDAVSSSARLSPDVVLMDLRMPGGSGIDACREILSAHRNIAVVFLSSYLDEEAMLAAVFAGARGYLLKEIGRESLLRAIRSAAEGRSILDSAAARTVVERMRSLARSEPAEGDKSLSRQQRRVLALVAEGKTNKEIGSHLKLSDKTVKNYLSNIFQKLRVHRRAQAAAIYNKRPSR